MDDSLKPNQPPVANAPTPSPSPLKQIRTYQGDVAKALARQNESLYSIQKAEKLRSVTEASDLANEERAQKRGEFFLLLLGSFVLLALSGAGGYYSYRSYLEKTAAPPVIAPMSRFIASESSVPLDINGLERDSLFSTISAAALENNDADVRHIVVNASTTDFFALLNTRAPGSLVRAFEETFMLGALGESRFLIFKLASFENAFGGMLLWEKTMPSDIGGLFSTSEVLKNITPASVFKDTVSRNKDARALYAELALENGTTTEPVLIYSFFDRNYLIITENFDVLQTLIERLTREKLSR